MNALRLWSFDEFMRQYNVWQLGIVIAYWKEVECTGALLETVGHSTRNADAPVPQELIARTYKVMLSYTVDQVCAIELMAARDRCDKLHVCLRDGLTWGELRTQAKVLREAIESELQYRRFAYVPTGNALLHDKFALNWDAIWSRFPASKEDSLRAADCYALEQDTACVFHLMRVSEIGLRAIAKKMRVTLKDKGKPMPVEFATWDKVINGIRTKITQAHAMSKSVRRAKQLQFYSDAADRCTYIRDIWRNEAAHTRKNYNHGEALGVLTRVREFMELLAKSL